MSVNIVVLTDAITVNGKKLHEVSLPDCIDRVLAGAGPNMSYEFLRGKKVIELTGPLECINRALEFFTPTFVNIDRIDNDEQIKTLHSHQHITLVRYVGPKVNPELLKCVWNAYVSGDQITICKVEVKNQTPPDMPPVLPKIGNDFKFVPLGVVPEKPPVCSQKMLGVLVACYTDMMKNDNVPKNIGPCKELMAENLEDIVKDFCAKNNMYDLAKFRALNRFGILKFTDFDKMNELTKLHCSPKQAAKLAKLEEINNY